MTAARVTAAALAGLWCAAASPAAAQPPEAHRVEPVGLQRGASAEVRIAGARLAGSTGLLLARGGLRVERFAAIDDQSALVTLATEPDCPLGAHPLWVVGPGGLSDLMVVRVGPFPIAEEHEPNDRPADAEAIPLGGGTTVRGVIDDGDVDCFAVPLRAGARLSIDVEAMRLGAAFLDSHLDVIGPDGGVVASADDDPLSLQDPRLSFLAEETGTHVVRLREAAFGGDFESRYMLHLGDFPVLHAVCPAGGPPGEMLTVVLPGGSGEERAARVGLPSGRAPWFHWAPVGPSGAPAVTPIPLRVVAMRNVVESVGEGPTPAGDAPVALCGVLRGAEEVDRFAFDAPAGELLQVEAFAARIGSPVDTVIEVEGPEGPIVVNDDGAAVHDSRARFRAPAAGRYVLSVRDHLGRGGERHAYRVEVGPVGPALELTTPTIDPLRPQASQRVHVPRGGRTALLIGAGRDRLEGAVEVGFDPLPAGVRVSVDHVPADDHLAVALFEAADDAPLGACLAVGTGSCQRGDDTITGRLSHDVGLVFGEPRRTPYWGVTLYRTPVAVTEPAPFSLEVDPPGAALAIDGRLDLVVRVERRGGFVGAVTINAPRLPGWVSRSEDPVVVGPAAEVVAFPLYSDRRAQPGDHRLVLTGSGRIDGYEIEAATDWFPLTVVEPAVGATVVAATSEQGAQTSLRCDLRWEAATTAPVVATLHGLPKHARADAVRVPAGADHCEFSISVGAQTPPSLHNTLYVEFAVGEPGREVRQFTGRGGSLEVVPPGGAARRRESRLEELRAAAGLDRSSTTPEGTPL